MEKIILSSNGIANMTAVSNTFIDNFMPMADGAYVKVYLYLLRCLGQPSMDISISQIADKLDNTERDVIRALCYWERHKLLMLTRNNDIICGISLNNPECDNSCIHTDRTKSKTANVEAVNEASDMTNNTNSDSLTSLISLPLEVLMEDETFANMISLIEASYIQRPLSMKESEFIADLYRKYQFGTCLILDLFDQCLAKIDIKKGSFIPYMTKVANSWYKKGIDSSNKAKECSSSYLECYGIIKKVFGISGRDLSTVETKFIQKWHEDNHFSPSMIELACEKCMRRHNEENLSYTDGILEAWKNKGIKTLEEAQASDASYKENKNNKKSGKSVKKSGSNFYSNYTQRDYDDEFLENLELELLSR